MSDHKTDEAKGRAKEAAGAITGDKDLKNEGKADQAIGRAKERALEIKDAWDEGKGMESDD
ncbi:MAG: CsbD family protein [Rhizobiales bacterium]|nr:CsbD family protein [Hyphomicrobiales bacterium]